MAPSKIRCLCLAKGSASGALADALRRASAGQVHASDRAALAGAVEELWRQLHQHAAGVPVLTPPHILAALAGD